MPNPQLQTPSEAIEFFRTAGFHAFEREWAIGRSIGVAADPFDHAGIKGWRRMVYIAPTDDGWALHNLRTTADGPTLVGTLEQACHQAVEALRTWGSLGERLPSNSSLERTRGR